MFVHFSKVLLVRMTRVLGPIHTVQRRTRKRFVLLTFNHQIILSSATTKKTMFLTFLFSHCERIFRRLPCNAALYISVMMMLAKLSRVTKNQKNLLRTNSHQHLETARDRITEQRVTSLILMVRKLTVFTRPLESGILLVLQRYSQSQRMICQLSERSSGTT